MDEGIPHVTHKLSSIYVLVDPRDNSYKYVGKTTATLEYRLRQHIHDANRRCYEHVRRFIWINELRSLGLFPEILLLEGDVYDWQEAEQSWIKKLRLAGHALINGTDGGDGIHGYRHSEETRQKQSESAKRRYEQAGEREKTGSSVSKAYKDPAVRQKLRNAWQRRPCEFKENCAEKLVEYAKSPEGRAKTSRVHTGKIVREETRAKLSKIRKGVPLHPDVIAAIADGHRGLKRSVETKQKMSEGNKRFYSTLSLQAKANKRWRLTGENVLEIFRFHKDGRTNKSIAEEFNIHPTIISHVLHRRAYKHVMIPPELL